MDGCLTANPRQYWLAAQALFTKLSKLFQLGFSTSAVKPSQTSSVSSLAAASGVVFGTSPHGLSADNPPAHQETSGKAGDRFPAKPVLTVGELPPVVQAQERRNVVPRLRRAPAPEELHRLELTEREFLHAYFAVEHERNRTRQAIRQGKATAQDLQATDDLWDKLQAVMFARMKGGQA